MQVLYLKVLVELLLVDVFVALIRKNPYSDSTLLYEIGSCQVFMTVGISW